MSIPMRLKDGEVIAGLHPVVIVGPNGAGKTKYIADRARDNQNAEVIGALRNIALADEVPNYTRKTAAENLINSLNERSSQHWLMSNEINALFAKLLADDADSARRFRDNHSSDPTAAPESTVLQRARRLWTMIFPGRSIAFWDNVPTITSEYAAEPGATSYRANQMSDGERVALYLVARVLNAKSGLLFVDEPELFFHSRLAVLFWDELESERGDIRFIYSTHDLTFALSRKGRQFVLVNPITGTQVLPVEKDVPRGRCFGHVGSSLVLHLRTPYRVL